MRARVGIGQDAAHGFETAGEWEGWQYAGLFASGAAEQAHLGRLAWEHAEARDPAGGLVEPDEDAAALERLVLMLTGRVKHNIDGEGCCEDEAAGEDFE